MMSTSNYLQYHTITNYSVNHFDIHYQYNLQVVVLLASWMVGQTTPAEEARGQGSVPR